MFDQTHIPRFLRSILLPAILLAGTVPAYGMHIMEGYLPLGWSALWWVVALPFVVICYRYLLHMTAENPKMKVLLALSAAFVFILSALKVPSVTGSSSHLTGIALGTILISPWSMPLVGVIVLLFQALLLAHGGLTTLGANVVSMTVVGPFVTYFLLQGLNRLKCPEPVNLFISTFFGVMSVYLTTSFQLAFAFPDHDGGVWSAAMKFMSIYAVTQVPLAVLEGVLTIIVVRVLRKQGVKWHGFDSRKEEKP